MKFRNIIIANVMIFMILGAGNAWAAKKAEPKQKTALEYETEDEMLERIDREIRAAINACGAAAVNDFAQEAQDETNVLIYAVTGTIWAEVDMGRIKAQFSQEAQNLSDSVPSGKFKNQTLEVSVEANPINEATQRRLVRQIKTCIKNALGEFQQSFQSIREEWTIRSVPINERNGYPANF
ncbi:MAG: hypothetical protein HY747_06080 [Elusimicrobia bacterium]|nr:hypothetical protein [Elusimicrobiota bacterium]